MDVLVWLGILFCITQSAMFSGLNLAFFSLSRLQLEVEAENGSRAARRILALRKDANFLLTTILWGNVGINVLLTLLSNSVLAGVAAFFFSTILITFGGEILPQAYFSRNALRMASLLAPVLRLYQLLLFPVAKPTAWMLDRWLGKEAVTYFGERDLRRIIRTHIAAEEADVEAVEGTGALNFLAIDDVPVLREGERVDPASIIALPLDGDDVALPLIEPGTVPPFLHDVHASGHPWVILTDPAGEPRYALDADGLIRAALLDAGAVDARAFCHRPILVTDANARLGDYLGLLEHKTVRRDDDVIDHDLIVVWTADERRVITGADILGRLLRGISRISDSRVAPALAKVVAEPSAEAEEDEGVRPLVASVAVDPALADDAAAAGADGNELADGHEIAEEAPTADEDRGAR